MRNYTGTTLRRTFTARLRSLDFHPQPLGTFEVLRILSLGMPCGFRKNESGYSQIFCISYQASGSK